jgi:DNA-directed RNA polymerase specialized sigma subunit
MVGVNRYKVLVRRSGRWWAFEAPAVPGAFGQTRRLDQIEDAARDVVAMMLDLPEESIGIDVERSLDALEPIIQDVQEKRKNAELMLLFALLAMVYAVHRLRAEGLSTRDTAELVGVSHQRVSQLEREDPARIEQRIRELELVA